MPMPSTFLRRKWERVFYTFFDINRNKSIDWNDFELLFEKIKELRGEDSKEYRICEDSMRMVWKGLLTESMGLDMMAPPPLDATVSLMEWNRIWQDFNPYKMPIWQWEYLKYMFFLLDQSGDKFIDEVEYTNVMAIYGMSSQDARKAFNHFSVNEQGKHVDKIDYGAFYKRWTEYFCSDDPKAPGSYLFGPW